MEGDQMEYILLGSAVFVVVGLIVLGEVIEWLDNRKYEAKLREINIEKQRIEVEKQRLKLEEKKVQNLNRMCDDMSDRILNDEQKLLDKFEDSVSGNKR